MNYKTHRVVNSSVLMEEDITKLMEYLDDGWTVINVHNNTDGGLTVYLLGRKS